MGTKGSKLQKENKSQRSNSRSKTPVKNNPSQYNRSKKPQYPKNSPLNKEERVLKPNQSSNRPSQQDRDRNITPSRNQKPSAN